MRRKPEPELMDVPERARAYAEADFDDVNAAFVEALAAAAGPRGYGVALDVGTGPGDIAYMTARALPGWRVVGLDGSRPMLRHAIAGFRGYGADAPVDARPWFVCADAKSTPFCDGAIDLFYSNSILHHLSDAAAFWREAKRLLAPGGLLFVRDLLRPGSKETAYAIVETYSGSESPLLKEDFYNSLLAAYTLEEVEKQLAEAGLSGLTVTQVSDRHLEIAGPRD